MFSLPRLRGAFPVHILIFLGCLAAALGLGPSKVTAQDGMTVIRDTEIEDMIGTWSEPVIKAAGLNPESINFILVQSGSINAFVAGGQNIFIYTGLLEKTENPGEVVGVIAHELGHIRGGHLIRMRQAYENASYESLLGAILGIGVAIATGQGGAGAAISAGAQSMASRSFLSHSRIQESSADQAALGFLRGAGLGAQGFVSFLTKLEDQDALPETQQTEYVRTHPLSRDRVDAVRLAAAQITGGREPYPPAWNEQHARMKAKLLAFISPEQVPWNYSDSDKSVPARYARAIAAYRLNKVDEALKLADGLLASEPDNPYFLELKGQMLRDFGRLPESLGYYRKATALRGDKAPLIEIDYAHVLLETAGNDNGKIRQAIDILNKVKDKERRSPLVHRLLATAYGRLGNEPVAKLELAEEALLQSRFDFAESQAKAAQAGLKKGSPEWIRAGDILSAIDQEKQQ